MRGERGKNVDNASMVVKIVDRYDHYNEEKTNRKIHPLDDVEAQIKVEDTQKCSRIGLDYHDHANRVNEQANRTAANVFALQLLNRKFNLALCLAAKTASAGGVRDFDDGGHLHPDPRDAQEARDNA